MALAKSICTGINLQTSGEFQIKKLGKEKPAAQSLYGFYI